MFYILSVKRVLSESNSKSFPLLIARDCKTEVSEAIIRIRDTAFEDYKYRAAIAAGQNGNINFAQLNGLCFVIG